MTEEGRELSSADAASTDVNACVRAALEHREEIIATKRRWAKFNAYVDKWGNFIVQLTIGDINSRGEREQAIAHRRYWMGSAGVEYQQFTGV